MATLTKQERERRKDWAKLLYVKDKRTQKEIADTVGVSEKTITDWKQTDNWDRLRESMMHSREEQLKNLYDQIRELNEYIKAKDEGKKFASSSEADAIKKLTSSIKDLEREVNITEVIDVSMGLINHIREHDFNKAKEVSNFCDAYIQSLIK
jgi:uncharacterized protein YjcR